MGNYLDMYGSEEQEYEDKAFKELMERMKMDRGIIVTVDNEKEKLINELARQKNINREQQMNIDKLKQNIEELNYQIDEANFYNKKYLEDIERLTTASDKIELTIDKAGNIVDIHSNNINIKYN